MKSSEIKEITTKELAEKVEIEKAFLVKMKLNHAVSPLENPLKIKDARRNVARLITELNFRKSIDKNNKES